jgi:hypothetical protein
MNLVQHFDRKTELELVKLYQMRESGKQNRKTHTITSFLEAVGRIAMRGKDDNLVAQILQAHRRVYY